jgi:lipid-A-disaccharide synthase
MRIFVSAGEPSGDLHGANLVRALRLARPDVEVVGFGGERMAAAGCRLLYPLTDLAVTGFRGILESIPTFWRVLGLARRQFRAEPPDAVVLIDYPGFHWWLAGCAKKHGIPVAYFVPPQLWAWAGYRVRKMRRLTDLVLTALPFEHDWFAARGVNARYVGHPYFDELSRQRLDAEFVGEQRSRPGPVIALLPGSRRGELAYSRLTLARAAGLIHRRRPDARFLVACLKREHADALRPFFGSLGLPLTVWHGKTAEIVHLAHSCLSVSGSVSLELLYRGKPSVMFYNLHPLTIWFARRTFALRSITLVNLLAGRRLFPEYVAPTNGGKVITGDGLIDELLEERLAAHVLHWLEDRGAYEGLCGELAALARQAAPPGACERAAAAILGLAGGLRSAVSGQQRAAG